MDNKEIGFLEPVDFQLALLGKMNARDQKAFLGQTLKDLDIAAQMADDMLKYWKKGDADNLYALAPRRHFDVSCPFLKEQQGTHLGHP